MPSSLRSSGQKPKRWAMASCGAAKVTGRPSISIVPDVGSYSPYSTFMSVDLPAPFSPSKQWI